MDIAINVRDVYGTRKAYPFGPSAERFAAIAGTKTLTQRTLQNVLALGFDVRVYRDGCLVGHVYSDNRDGMQNGNLASLQIES